MTCASIQLGPQQLKYMTVLKDSSDRLSFSSLALLITIAEVEGERLLAWDTDLRWFLAFCWADLMTWFHLQIPSWSFMASTTPTLAATKALLVWLIFYIYTLLNSLLNLLFNLETTNWTNLVWLTKLLIQEGYMCLNLMMKQMIEGRSLIYRLGEPWEVCAAKPWGLYGICRWFWSLGIGEPMVFLQEMTILPL
jgi:hypothetical protein